MGVSCSYSSAPKHILFLTNDSFKNCILLRNRCHYQLYSKRNPTLCLITRPFSNFLFLHRSTPLDICQGACSRVSRAYIARRMHLPQDLLLRRRVSPFGFFRAQRLHSIMELFVVLIYTFLSLLALSTSL